MTALNFIFGIHNHQPVGNFNSVFAQAYARSYKPLLDVLERHPKINWNLHVSGILWDWLSVHEPEFLARVRALVDEGRLELLTGGYYEPIISSLPDADKAGQIKKLSDYITERFGCVPRGLWLAERVWEPHLPKILAESGIKYTVVDDAHFFAAGMNSDQLTGYYTIEEQGSSLAIFPIHQIMRYMIPFKDVDSILKYFKQYAEKHDQGLLVMADDGEKFGLWPGTYAHVYEKGWLENFCNMLESHEHWIKTWKFSDFMKSYPSKGAVFLPTASYYEMSEWTLPAHLQSKFEAFAQSFKNAPNAEDFMPFMRSANWRNFFFKYAESNNMHKKMVYISKKINSLGTKDQDKKNKALNYLWSGQCNCAYWHGVFGGLYLPHLREAIYANLLKAETLYDEMSDTQRPYRHSVADYNADGSEEILVEGKSQNFYFMPHRGGALAEWDYKPDCFNISNVLTRRKESYHQKLLELARVPVPEREGAGPDSPKTIHDILRPKESGLEDCLFYDWHDRLSFLDHFLNESVTLDQFRRSTYGEQGNFILAHYNWRIREEKGRNITLKLFYEGRVWAGSVHCPVLVSKELEFLPEGGLDVCYTITNLSGQKLDLWLGVELNFLLDRKYKAPQNLCAQTHSLQTGIKDTAVKFSFEDKIPFWQFPIETVSQSEEGYEKTFQGVCLLPQWKFSLDAAESKTYRWNLSVSSLTP